MFRFIKEYFSLSNNEQRGIIGLILIILLSFIGFRMYFMLQEPKVVLQDNSAVFAALYIEEELPVAAKEKEETKAAINYFYFNPNTVSKENLLALGFKESVATTLINFRSKGGQFRKKEDLLKVYGVEQDFYNQLQAYIDIPVATSTKKTYVKDEPKVASETSPKWEKKEVLQESIEINAADSASLVTVKGIGPVFAARIVKYRQLLGGFLHLEQLLEVYGIDQEKYEGIASQLTCSAQIKQIDVNKATWQELVAHPYIDSPTANILLNYKKAHGSITSFDFIIENKLMTQETLDKITPYLSLK